MKKHRLTITQANQKTSLQQLSQLIRQALQQTDVVVELSRPKRNLDQNAKFHALITDIRNQATDTIGFLGSDGQLKKWTGRLKQMSFYAVKGWLVTKFLTECEASGLKINVKHGWVYDFSLQCWVAVRPSTTQFDKATGAAFIEYLQAYGAEKGVKFRAPKHYEN